MNLVQKVKLHSLLARIGTWLLVLALLFLLRSFFLLLFLTFVFAFLQGRGVDLLDKRIRNHSLRTWLVGITLLSSIVGLGIFLAPNIKDQTSHFVGNFGNYVQAVDKGLLELSGEYPILKDAVDNVSNGGSPTMGLLQQLLGLGDEDASQGQSIAPALSHLAEMSGKIFGIVSAFLLSLLLSFLIVLDRERLKATLRGLENSRLRFIYREVTPSIQSFAQVLGHALEAQFVIALVNSLLTTIGVFTLGLGHYWAFLGTIVFLFSFVPVAGVFISSIPICLIALQYSGFQTMLLAIGMITLVHMIEAYYLNPRIYGSKLKINPVIVLFILTIGGKLMGFWGLVLGVPLYTWFITHAISLNSDSSSPKHAHETTG